MSIFTAVRNQKQTAGALHGAMQYVMDPRKTIDGERNLVTGINCTAYTAFVEMMTTKRQFKKIDGRQFYQFVQSFPADAKITPAEVHEIGLEFAKRQFPEYEVLVATHCNTEHLHNHFIVNAVSFQTGKKLHQNHEDLEQHRKVNDEICAAHGQEILEHYGRKPKQKPMKTKEYQAAIRQQSWKFQLIKAIEEALVYSTSKETFIQNMNYEGYDVAWSDSRKYITYTCPNGRKCRDNKLHDDTYLKENMEKIFAYRQAAGFIPLTPEPKEGWLTQAETFFSEMVRLGYHVEQSFLPPENGRTIARNDRKLKQREALKKLAHGHKLSSEEENQKEDLRW